MGLNVGLTQKSVAYQHEENFHEEKNQEMVVQTEDFRQVEGPKISMALAQTVNLVQCSADERCQRISHSNRERENYDVYRNLQKTTIGRQDILSLLGVHDYHNSY